MTDIPIPPTLGLVLAGGLARRMGGGDKARLEIGGITILDRVLATLSGQCIGHHHQRQWRPRALRRHRLRRGARQRPGPSRAARRHSRRARLAGRSRTTASNGCSACRATARSCPTIWSSGCTRPGARWAPACRSPAPAPANGGIRWWAYGRWRCAQDLRKALVEDDLRKIEVWTARHGVAIADWPAEPVDPFFNVNTPEDAERATRIALQQS